MGMKLKHIYEFGPFRLDAIERVLLREGKPVLVPPKDLETLLVLVESRGHIVEKNELLERVWPGTFVEEGNLTKHISNLRQLLGDGLNETTHIETIPRRGYRFVAPVNELEPVPAQTGNPRFVETLPRRGYRFIATANGWEAPAAIEGPRLQPAPTPDAKTALRVLGLAALVLTGVAVVLVGLNVSGWRERLLPRIQSLAVLPLENLSGDPSQEYFADGMTEELITQLGKIRALRVISRTSVNRYKGTKKPLQEIARELDVDAVVEGTVARSGSRVRVTANLVRVSPEKHLWSERYERDLRDVLLIQEDVAQAVANEIRVQLTPHSAASCTFTIGTGRAPRRNTGGPSSLTPAMPQLTIGIRNSCSRWGVSTNAWQKAIGPSNWTRFHWSSVRVLGGDFISRAATTRLSSISARHRRSTPILSRHTGTSARSTSRKERIARPSPSCSRRLPCPKVRPFIWERWPMPMRFRARGRRQRSCLRS